MDLIHIVAWIREHSVLMMLAVFVLIVAATYWPGRKSSIERNGMIPLEDDK